MDKETRGNLYLGDGVYIRFDGMGYVLTAENGLNVTDTIYLEPDVLENLIVYVKGGG